MATEYSVDGTGAAAYAEHQLFNQNFGWPLTKKTYTKTCTNDYPTYFTGLGSKYDLKTATYTTTLGNKYIQYCDGGAKYGIAAASAMAVAGMMVTM